MVSAEPVVSVAVDVSVRVSPLAAAISEFVPGEGVNVIGISHVAEVAPLKLRAMGGVEGVRAMVLPPDVVISYGVTPFTSPVIETESNVVDTPKSSTG